VANARISRSHRVLIGSAVLIGALIASPFAAGAAPHLASPTSPAVATSTGTPSTSTTSTSTTSTSTTEPALTTPGQVTTRLAELATANEKLAEQLNKAMLDVAHAEKAATKASAALTSAQQTLSSARRALATSLAMQYKSATFGRTASLFASASGQSYLDRVQTLNRLAAHQSEVAQVAAGAAAAVRASQQRAQLAVARADARKAAVQKQRAALQSRIRKYQRMLATLTASARSAYYGSSNATPDEIALAASNYTIGASATDVIAVRTALAQLGKPYVWAAAGPDTFDCSGLTMVAWQAAGVQLPHLASAQQSMGTRVDKSQLRPGDLVFFGSPAYHVAMYIGSGMIVQAPNSGDVVKISPLAAMSDYTSAARFG
jgi:cell wall-associated NlpC family hydrolase